MRTYSRAFPGAIAFLASFLSGYSWTTSGDPASFTISHIASALLCVSAPIAFVLVGRALRCRPDLLRLGAVLLSISGIPMLIANGIYLFSIRTPENAVADIGGIGLALLGWAALLITSLACAIGLPLARRFVTDQRITSASSRI